MYLGVLSRPDGPDGGGGASPEEELRASPSKRFESADCQLLGTARVLVRQKVVLNAVRSALPTSGRRLVCRPASWLSLRARPGGKSLSGAPAVCDWVPWL